MRPLHFIDPLCDLVHSVDRTEQPRNAAQPYAEQARQREADDAAAAPPDRPPYPGQEHPDDLRPGGGWQPQQMPHGASGSPWDAGEPPPRRPGAGSDADDGWGGQSFGDALAAPGRPAALVGAGRAGGPDAGGGATPGRGPADLEAPTPAASRGRRPKASPPDDGGFGGQSLGDCFKKAPPPPAPGGGAAASGGGASRASRAPPPPEGGGPGADEIVKWLRSLPLSHVPEKAQNELCAVVEEANMGGHEFDGYVQQVPPEICAPRHAMKLKAAWANKMKEAACVEVALYNLNNKPTQKGISLKI
ncbi:unnamed protein product [Prorocentrum cordatum]|uniref:Uncharacterized protein n=1 Tax=Prorocentrum cordatum TaxID=2364126 RepID=A0ABN9Y090_9DINO|nr:unnamed protein product [Polarella glacialis]